MFSILGSLYHCLYGTTCLVETGLNNNNSKRQHKGPGFVQRESQNFPAVIMTLFTHSRDGRVLQFQKGRESLMCLWPKLDEVKITVPSNCTKKTGSTRGEPLHVIKYKCSWKVPLTWPFKDVAGRGKPLV